MRIFFTLLGVAAGLLISRKQRTAPVAQQKTEAKSEVALELPPGAPHLFPVSNYKRYDPNEDVLADVMEKSIRACRTDPSSPYLGLYAGSIPSNYVEILNEKARGEATRKLAESYCSGEIPEMWTNIIDKLIAEKLKKAS